MKLLATDLDGTLLKENELSGENEKAIEELKNKGYKLVISTGRPLNGIKKLRDILGEKIDYYVLLNGAYILDKNLKEIEHNLIEKNTVKEIVEKYTYKDTRISFEEGDLTYTYKNDCENLCYEKKKRVEEVHEVDKDIRLISLCYRNHPIEEIDKLSKDINKNFKEVTAYRNVDYIDVVPKGCSKGNGVKKVCLMEDIEPSNLYTIGDSWNDVTMFEITENSFTFNDVEENLKIKAKNIVDSVGQCIEEYILDK